VCAQCAQYTPPAGLRGDADAGAAAPPPLATVAAAPLAAFCHSATSLALAMAGHARLGADSPLRKVASSRDLLQQIMRHIELVVPDDAPSLAAALHRAAPWQRVLLRRGEHICSSASRDAAQESALVVSSPIVLCGEPGAVVRGSLHLTAACAGGSISDLKIEDGGDCCVRCEGGRWELSNLWLKCCHAAAVLACGGARVTLSDCQCGGEEPLDRSVVALAAYGSLQMVGLSKRACYAIVARNRAEVSACGCELHDASEAGVLLAHEAAVQLRRCNLRHCKSAFMSGRGRALELDACTSRRPLLSPYPLDRPPPLALALSSLGHVSCTSLSPSAPPPPRRHGGSERWHAVGRRRPAEDRRVGRELRARAAGARAGEPEARPRVATFLAGP